MHTCGDRGWFRAKPSGGDSGDPSGEGSSPKVVIKSRINRVREEGKWAASWLLVHTSNKRAMTAAPLSPAVALFRDMESMQSAPTLSLENTADKLWG